MSWTAVLVWVGAILAVVDIFLAIAIYILSRSNKALAEKLDRTLKIIDERQIKHKELTAATASIVADSPQSHNDLMRKLKRAQEVQQSFKHEPLEE